MIQWSLMPDCSCKICVINNGYRRKVIILSRIALWKWKFHFLILLQGKGNLFNSGQGISEKTWRFLTVRKKHLVISLLHLRIIVIHSTDISVKRPVQLMLQTSHFFLVPVLHKCVHFFQTTCITWEELVENLFPVENAKF